VLIIKIAVGKSTENKINTARDAIINGFQLPKKTRFFLVALPVIVVKLFLLPIILWFMNIVSIAKTIKTIDKIYPSTVCLDLMEE